MWIEENGVLYNLAMASHIRVSDNGRMRVAFGQNDIVSLKEQDYKKILSGLMPKPKAKT